METLDFGKLDSSELQVELIYNAKGKVVGAKPKTMLAGPVLWYNADEAGRVKSSNEYGSRGNDYLYPAVEQELNRDHLLYWGYKMTGHWFLKSACVECPFPSLDYLIERAQKEWREFARTVVREMQVFRLNPRMHQYGFGTSYWVAKEHSPQALALALELWEQRGPWRIMQMRRVVQECPAPSEKNPIKWRTDSSRCLTTLQVVPTYAEAVQALGQYGEFTWIDQTDLKCLKHRTTPAWVKQLSYAEKRDRTLAGEDLRGEAYIGNRIGRANWGRFICHPFPVVELRPRNLLQVPRCEEWITIVPNCITDKVANAQGFESLWESTLGYGKQFCLF